MREADVNNEKKLLMLRFAGDIAVLAETENDLENLLNNKIVTI